MLRKTHLFIIAGIIIPMTTVALVLGFRSNNEEKIYHVVYFDSNGGTPVEQVKVQHGNRINRPVCSKTGYEVIDWHDEDLIWNFETMTVISDMTLTANWTTIDYQIIYDFKGGTTSEEYSKTYTIESDFDLVRPVKGGQVFTGWFDNNGKRFDEITPGLTGDIYLTAEWVNNINPISDDESRGSINVYVSETNPNEYTFTNNPVANKHHLFKGWFDVDGNLLSEESQYTTIISPNETYTIHSKYMNDEEEDEWNISHGVMPTISGNKVIYGLYPQSNVNDEELIEQLNDLKRTRYNNYIYYNHEYYAKRVSRLARDLNTHELLSIRKFDNGDEFIEDETYWFKVEPVSWKILKESSNQYNLVSEKLIDVQRYHRNSSIRTIDEKTIYSNNYKYSDIRKWLNNDFISASFAFNKSNLTIMEIDNSKESTATPDSGLECENTFDYVTLLSYKEQEQNTLVERQIKTTDYVRVSGANYSVNENNLFSGYYWTRSPIESEDEDKNGTAVSRCNMNGTLNSDYVGWGGSCVQPSIKISK